MQDSFNRQWIIENSRKILTEYSNGMTVRQLYYRLVSIGMTNDYNHYKRVVNAMTQARWDNIVSMDVFIDRERSMYGETKSNKKDLVEEIKKAKTQVKAWIRNYSLNRWSNQENYVEVWIEKKALQGVFEHPCMFLEVGLAACKGYPSITFLNEAKQRFKNAIERKKKPVILYFGDYDPSGKDIPRSLKENLKRMGVFAAVERIALNPEQIKEMKLPGARPKKTDSRTVNWNGGSVVELDAVEPKTLAKLCHEAIECYFDDNLFEKLQQQEANEQERYQQELKKFVKIIGGNNEN